jgi:spermidine synthase
MTDNRYGMKRCMTSLVNTLRSITCFITKTDHQDLVIFENAAFGRVMALDGVVQTTERDEFIYHEMMTHVPLWPTAREARSDHRRR